MRAPAATGTSAWLAPAAVLVLAAALRLLHLGQAEFWWDEFVTIGRSLPSLPELLAGLMYQSPNVATDCSPPLHHLLVHAALAAGRSGWAIRMPSVLCGLASIAFVFLIGRRLFGSRAGLLAALFCAVAAFHIYYSRDIRWYSTFYAASLGSLHFLLLAMESGRRRHWLLFSGFTALSLYASYMAAMFVAGMGAWVCLAAWGRLRAGDGAGALALLLKAFAALALAALLYAPWIPAQYYAYLSFRGKGERVPLEWGFFARAFRFYLEYFQQGAFDRLWIAAPVCLAGIAAGLASLRLRPGLAAVSCWALVPVVGVYSVKTEFGVSPKYVMSLFYWFAFLLGLGLDALGRALEKSLGLRGAAPGWALALGLLAAASWSNFDYATFYRGVMYSDKARMRDAALLAAPGTAFLFDTPRSLSFLGHWYLGDAFPTARGVLDRRYRRALLVSGDSLDLPGLHPALRRKGFSVDRLGLANASPLPVIPDAQGLYVHREGFRDLSLHANAHETRNAAVDLALGGLTPADTTRPGEALFAFALPEGVGLEAATLALQATVVRRNLPDIDGWVEVSAGTDPASLAPVGRLDVSDAPADRRGGDYRGVYVMDKAFGLPQMPPGPGVLYVGLRFSIGTRDGSFTVSSLELLARCSGRAVGEAEAARLIAAPLLANLGPETAPAPQGAVEPGRLAAFTLDEALSLPGAAGSAAQRERYLAERPGARPVFTARLPGGRPFLELYDPWLERSLDLAPGEAFDAEVREPLAGVRAPGTPVPSLLDYGGAVLPLSMGAPSGAEVFLNPGGRGMVYYRPVFDEGRFNPLDVDSLRDARIKPEDNGLTCLGDGLCFMAWRFRSLFPFQRVVVTAYPRMLHDRERRNRLRMLLCAEGGPCREMLAVESSGRGGWEGPGVHEVRELVLDKPMGEVTLRLEMTGDACLWTSSADQPMTFELFFDAPRLPVDSVGRVRLANVSPDGGLARATLSPRPFPAWEALRPGLTLPAPGGVVPPAP